MTLRVTFAGEKIQTIVLNGTTYLVGQGYLENNVANAGINSN
jgi:hypothetical protein